MKTYGGRRAEGERVFSVPISEVLYWNKFRYDEFWDSYIESLRIAEEIRAKRPERRERTREMLDEYFEECDRL